MITKSAFGNTIRSALSKVFKEDYLYNDYGENWLCKLLIRLKLRKVRRTLVPGAYEELLKPGLRKNFEESFGYKYMSIWKDER